MKRITIFLQLIINIVVGIVVTLLIRNYFFYKNIEIDLGAWSVFYTVYGVLYAIIVGFILVGALGKFDQLKQTVDTEINKLQSVRDFLTYFSENQKDLVNNVRKVLSEYVDSIIKIEWDEMIKKDSMPEFSKEFGAIIESVSHLKSEDENDSIALTSIMNTLSGLTDCRTKRISLSNEEVPPPIMKLLIFMSIILTLGFIILGVENFWIHIFMIWSLSSTVQLIINLLVDLNNPFVGVWLIDKAHYQGIKESIDERISKEYERS